MNVPLGHFDGGVANRSLTWRDFSSDKPRGERVTQVVDSKVLNFGYVAGRAEASANIIESGAVLPAKHPFCFWAVPISEQPAGHEGSVRGMINRDDSALAVFCVVALKGESPDLEVDA